MFHPRPNLNRLSRSEHTLSSKITVASINRNSNLDCANSSQKTTTLSRRTDICWTKKMNGEGLSKGVATLYQMDRDKITLEGLSITSGYPRGGPNPLMTATAHSKDGADDGPPRPPTPTRDCPLPTLDPLVVAETAPMKLSSLGQVEATSSHQSITPLFSPRLFEPETITCEEDESQTPFATYVKERTFPTSPTHCTSPFSATSTSTFEKLLVESRPPRVTHDMSPPSEDSRSDMARNHPQSRFCLPATGISPTISSCAPPSTLFLIGKGNCSLTVNISRRRSERSDLSITAPSSSSTNTAEISTLEPIPQPCPTSLSSPQSTPASLSVSPKSPPQRRPATLPAHHADRRTTLFVVATIWATAVAALIATSVWCASNLGTYSMIALSDMGIVNPVLNMGDSGNEAGPSKWTESSILGMEPRYLRGYSWHVGEQSRNPSVEYTLIADPLPSPPDSVFRDLDVGDTLLCRPDLFRIVTPINVERFEWYLRPHPNRAFVESVIRGLREGFWPYAKGSDFGSSIVMPNHPTVAQDMDILRAARDRELEMERFSHGFQQLLPGMRTSPLGLVPKPHSDKFRLITDHSAGPTSLNSFIGREDSSVHYDNLRDLGRSLLAYREEHGDDPLLLWKSDIAEAFRLLPVHPWWQVKQVVEIDGEYFVDHNLVFGSRASPKIWCAFAALVGWIAWAWFGIDPIQHYVDDFWSFWRSPRRARYKDGRLLPESQVRFLNLLDELGIPHKPEKQIYGHRLEVIGFEVDPNQMQIRMEREKRTDLVRRIREFVQPERDPETGAVKDRRRMLKEWLRMLGELNWALNIMPLGRPALSSSYAKVFGDRVWEEELGLPAPQTKKFGPNTRIYHNKTTKRDLLWFAARLEASDGVSLIESRMWHPEAAQRRAYVDASLSGLGVFIPPRSQQERPLGLFYEFPSHPRYRSIYYNEMLAIICALAHFANHPEPQSPRIIIHSDSLISVDTFNSLRAGPLVNGLLMAAVDLIIDHGFKPRVVHIPGANNFEADCLSRGMFAPLYGKWPNLTLLRITPPRNALGEPEL